MSIPETTTTTHSADNAETGAKPSAKSTKIPPQRTDNTTNIDDVLPNLDADEPDKTKQSRTWAIAIALAAAIFIGALAIFGMRFFVSLEAVDDTPTRSVDSFLTTLLHDNDSAAAASWTCEAKADRNFDTEVAALAELSKDVDIEWSNITESSRTLGAATVTADVTINDETPLTWEFELVAENSTPQWLVCGIVSS